MTLPFPYDDFRPQLARANWSIGTRDITDHFTIHYNGPAVEGFGNPEIEEKQLQFDATYHMRPGALGAASGGDGIQYHGSTLSNGRNLQLRDWLAKLWHCGNTVGNRSSIAWHLPLGGKQRATQAQLHSLFDVVIPAFQREFGIKYISVVGHREWKSTPCPGDNLFQDLLDWRHKQAGLPRLLYYKTLANCNIREAPDVASQIAIHGTAVLPKDTTFAVSEIVSGKLYYGVRNYVHTADERGFVLNHPSMLVHVSDPRNIVPQVRTLAAMTVPTSDYDFIGFADETLEHCEG